MIFINRDKETKKLKETDGLKSREKSQLWRIFKFNKKIKPFRLSRSKFSDLYASIERVTISSRSRFWLFCINFTKI